MKLSSTNTGIVTIVLLFSIFLAKVPKEFTVTESSGDQRCPAIYGDIVVWMDERNFNSDIWGYSLSANQEFQITADPHGQRCPEIYEDIVVWMDNRNGYGDVYGYNLSTSEEFQITTDPHDQSDPAIYEDIVVWVDERNGNKDIYGYNLSTEEEYQITTDGKNQENPAIYGDIVVWEDERNGNKDIYGYNLLIGEEFEITANVYDQENPAIYGDIVVWEDFRSGGGDIYGYDLLQNQELQVTSYQGWESGPAIYENIVVWEGVGNDGYGIHGYNFSTRGEFHITTNIRAEWEQPRPAIYGDIVVWEDERNGNWNIYGCNLLSALGEAPNPSYRLFYAISTYEYIDFVFLIFFIVRITAPLILSVCFFRDYIVRRRRTSLAWGLGFLLSSQLSYFVVSPSSYTIAWVLSMVLAFGMTLIYYGTSLMIFSPGSFFREKMSAIIILIFSVFSYYCANALTSNFSPEGVLFLIELALTTPIFLTMAVSFYYISRQVDSNEFLMRTYFMISVAWFLLGIISVPRGLLFSDFIPFVTSSIPFLVISIVSGIAWILMVYNMIVRKAVVLSWKKREEKEKNRIFICPQCKNRIQKDWMVCPYCGAELR